MNTHNTTDTPRQPQSLPSLEPIQKRLRESLNLDDPRDKFAYQEWEKDAEKTRKAATEHDLAHIFVSPEVTDAAFEYCKADVEENKLLFQIRAARNERKIQKMKLLAALGQYDGYFPNEDEHEELVLVALAVCKLTKARLYQQVIDTSLKMAGDAAQLDSEAPAFPVALGDGIREFADDLRALIQENGDAGRQLVTRVCTDCDFAKKVREDDEMPKAIQFLAGLSLELRKKNKLPDKEVRHIGFASK